MVTLENLVKIGNIIEADYYYENETDKRGHFKYDITKDEYIELRKIKETEIEVGFGQIRNALHRLVRLNIFPETYHNIWY